jgi:predicted AlkP superfamily pyrophosphatase or phosphodiesterase
MSDWGKNSTIGFMKKAFDGARKRNIKFALGICLVLFFTGCATGIQEKWDGELQFHEYRELPWDEEAAKRHVVFIGLDGWGAYSVARADMPVVKRMISGGSFAPKARSVLPTNSRPNWSSLFMGSPPGVHGYAGPGADPLFQSPLRDRYGFFPTIFALLKSQRPQSTLALFYEWEEIGGLCPPEIPDRALRIPDLSANPEAVKSIARYIVDHKPSFTVIIFNEPDSVGHAKAHGSKAYYEKLRELDGLISLIVEGVKEGGIYEETVFIVSTDHGGFLWGHGFNFPRQREIPLVIYGKTIKSGLVLTGRINITDIAPTIGAIFKLEAPPAWTGRILTEVFE